MSSVRSVVTLPPVLVPGLWSQGRAKKDGPHSTKNSCSRLGKGCKATHSRLVRYGSARSVRVSGQGRGGCPLPTTPPDYSCLNLCLVSTCVLSQLVFCLSTSAQVPEAERRELPFATGPRATQVSLFVSASVSTKVSSVGPVLEKVSRAGVKVPCRAHRRTKRNREGTKRELCSSFFQHYLRVTR